MYNENKYSTNIRVYMQPCIHTNTASVFQSFNHLLENVIQKPVDIQVFHNA